MSGFRLPGEAQKIDRLMEKFAQRFLLCFLISMIQLYFLLVFFFLFFSLLLVFFLRYFSVSRLLMVSLDVDIARFTKVMASSRLQMQHMCLLTL